MAVTKTSGQSASHEILSDSCRVVPDTPFIPLGNSRVSSVLLTSLFKSAHWLIRLQLRVIDGAKAVEELLIEPCQMVRETPETLTGGTEDWLMGKYCAERMPVIRAVRR
jgi:hypothetical protein